MCIYLCKKIRNYYYEGETNLLDISTLSIRNQKMKYSIRYGVSIFYKTDRMSGTA